MNYKKLISHRGNLNGRIIDVENRQDYISDAIKIGYDVEIDVRVKDGSLYLGHDVPQYLIDLDWLQQNGDRLWIHCKDIESYRIISAFKNLQYFCHSHDSFSLISTFHLWVHDLTLQVNDKCIIPLLNLEDIRNYEFKNGVYAVCTDYVLSI